MRQGTNRAAGATIAVPVVPPAAPPPRKAKPRRASMEPTIAAPAVPVEERQPKRRRAKRSTAVNLPKRPAALEPQSSQDDDVVSGRTLLASDTERPARATMMATGPAPVPERQVAGVPHDVAADEEYDVDLQSMAAMSLPPDLANPGQQAPAPPAAAPVATAARSSRPITLGHAVIERQNRRGAWLLSAAGAALVVTALLLGTVAFATT